MNYAALAIIAVLVGAAALLWIALAAKMVSDDESAKHRAEAERRRLARQQEAARNEHRAAARAFAEPEDVGPEPDREEGPAPGG